MDLEQKSINIAKGLIMDTVRNANSGHTGGPLSSLDFAYVLFKDFLKFDSDDPNWFNRDRFVLSIGHESALLYTLLCYVGWLNTEDLKQFTGEYSQSINLNKYTRGIYFLQIETSKGVINKKLILQ